SQPRGGAIPRWSSYHGEQLLALCVLIASTETTYAFRRPGRSAQASNPDYTGVAVTESRWRNPSLTLTCRVLVVLWFWGKGEGKRSGARVLWSAMTVGSFVPHDFSEEHRWTIRADCGPV